MVKCGAKIVTSEATMIRCRSRCASREGVIYCVGMMPLAESPSSIRLSRSVGAGD